MSYSDSDLSDLDEEVRQPTKRLTQKPNYVEDDEDEDEDEGLEDDLGDEEDEELEEEELDDYEDEQLSSEGDGNFKLDDYDDDEIIEQVPEKKSTNLKLKLKFNYTEPEDSKIPRSRKQKDSINDKTKLKKPIRSRKNTTTQPNYYEEDEILSDTDDIIPTPSLDDEGLSDDDEQEQYKPVDVTKMTERQRVKHLDSKSAESANDSRFLSLSNNISKRKVLTEEENQLRKAETARKRKNFIEKKLEEEKQDTINKLLKRRAAKVSAASLKEDEENDTGGPSDKPRRPYIQHPALFRWISNKQEIRLGVSKAFNEAI